MHWHAQFLFCVYITLRQSTYIPYLFERTFFTPFIEVVIQSLPPRCVFAKIFFYTHPPSSDSYRMKWAVFIRFNINCTIFTKSNLVLKPRFPLLKRGRIHCSTLPSSMRPGIICLYCQIKNP